MPASTWASNQLKGIKITLNMEPLRKYSDQMSLLTIAEHVAVVGYAPMGVRQPLPFWDHLDDDDGDDDVVGLDNFLADCGFGSWSEAMGDEWARSFILSVGYRFEF